MRQHKGVATLLIVFVVALVGVFVVAAWQSRLLVAIQRNQSISDQLVVGYAAESESYDWVARFLGGYANVFNNNFSSNKTLPDGTILFLDGTVVGSTQTLNIKSKRPYSTSNIQLTRTVNTTSTASYDSVEILMSMDCTKSMDDASGITDKTRFDALRDSSVSFLETIKARPDASKFHIGLVVFKIDAKWLLPLTNDHQAVIDKIKNTFHSKYADNPTCQTLIDHTSVGSGLSFMNNYYNTVPASANTKRIEVSITDGEANSRQPDPKCTYFQKSTNLELATSYCPVNDAPCSASNSHSWNCAPNRSGNGCITLARMYLACQMADGNKFVSPEAPAFISDYLDDSSYTVNVKNKFYIPASYGARNPDVDLYTVTVYNELSDKEKKIYNDFSSKYYGLENASKLPEALQNILEEISTSISKIVIKKVTPTP